MAIANNVFLCEVSRPVNAYPAGAPSTNTATWISLKNYQRLTFLVSVTNDGTGGTALAIGLNQATSGTGAASKTLAFSQYYSNTDTATIDTLTLTTATSNTFNSNSTASKNGLYVLDVKSSDLDVANSFNYVQLTLPTTAAHVTALSVIGIARAERFGDQAVLTAL